MTLFKTSLTLFPFWDNIDNIEYCSSSLFAAILLSGINCPALPWRDVVRQLNSDPGPCWAIDRTEDGRLVELEGRAAHVVDWGGEALRLYQLPRVRPERVAWQMFNSISNMGIAMKQDLPCILPVLQQDRMMVLTCVCLTANYYLKQSDDQHQTNATYR